MGGFRYGPLHIEMKNGLGTGGVDLGQSTPAGIASTRAALAASTMADEVDVDVVSIGRPMAVKIIKEGRPVERKVMDFEVAQWERKAVVDANQCGRSFGKSVDKPFGNTAPCPVFASLGGGGTSTGGEARSVI
jgi:hypothetical protein